MSSKTTVKLGDICDVRDGTHDSPKPKPNGHPLVTSKHIKNGSIDFSSANLISAEDFESVNKRSKVDKFDVLMSMIGTVGEMVFVDKEPEFAIKNIGLIKTSGNELLGRYLYYYLKSPQAINHLSSAQAGSTQKFIGLGELRKFPIELWDEASQEKIVKILGDLDRKIELNRRMNETLEQIGQALFKKYFVDNPESEHWESVSLERIADVQYGFAFKSSAFNEKGEGKKIVRIRNVLEGDSNSYTTETATDNYVVNNGDLLVGMDGEFHIGYWTGGEAYLVQRVANFKAKDKFSNSFVKYVIGDPIHKLNKRGARTTVAHLSAKDIREIMFPFSDEEYGPLSEVFAVINRQQIHLLTQNRTLAELRDSILPKLMSGQISV